MAARVIDRELMTNFVLQSVRLLRLNQWEGSVHKAAVLTVICKLPVRK